MTELIAHERLIEIASRYFGVGNTLSSADLVERLEETAYSLARNNKQSDAKAIFIAVADHHQAETKSRHS